jgi:hypothetical protein
MAFGGSLKRKADSVRTPIALGALCALLVLAPKADATADSFEPNDSILNSAGPLANAQTYAAEITAPADRDFFFFYVTSADPADVTLKVNNFGGGSATSSINAAIVDTSGDPIDSFGFAIGNGGEATGTETLNAGKYFVEVGPVEGSTGEIAYRLRTDGGNGAFGPYTEIASKCAGAKSAAKAAKKRLGRARAKLERATGRLRRARFGAGEGQLAAREAFRRAKARVMARRAALEKAVGEQSPWCSIAK